MGLDGVVKDFCGYTKAFVKLFLEHEYPHVKFVDNQGLYRKKLGDSRDYAVHNIYKNNIKKPEEYKNGKD